MTGNKTEVEPVDNTKLNKDKNYLIQNCAVCKQEMQLDTGSVTLAGKWYHKDCYDNVQPHTNRNLIEDF